MTTKRSRPLMDRLSGQAVVGGRCVGSACAVACGENRAVSTALERAVDALSDPEVGLPDALRALLVVSRRIGATELSAWLRGELDGYAAGVAVPSYREHGDMPIDLHFEGPFGASAKRTVSPRELPEALRGAVQGLDVRAPVAELVELCEGDRDPMRPLPVQWVARYREFAKKMQAPTYEMMQLNHAAVKIPATHLKGLLDRIKTAALELALSLEDVSPVAGVAGGPTVTDEPRLAKQVTIHLTQLYADGATITLGDNATVATGAGAVAVELTVGDVEGLLKAARTFLGDGGVADLEKALEEDGGQPGRATNRFLDRVKQGAVVLAAGVTTNGAYDGLVALIGQVFSG